MPNIGENLIYLNGSVTPGVEVTSASQVLVFGNFLLTWGLFCLLASGVFGRKDIWKHQGKHVSILIKSKLSFVVTTAAISVLLSMVTVISWVTGSGSVSMSTCWEIMSVSKKRYKIHSSKYSFQRHVLHVMEKHLFTGTFEEYDFIVLGEKNTWLF